MLNAELRGKVYSEWYWEEFIAVLLKYKLVVSRHGEYRCALEPKIAKGVEYMYSHKAKKARKEYRSGFVPLAKLLHQARCVFG